MGKEKRSRKEKEEEPKRIGARFASGILSGIDPHPNDNLDKSSVLSQSTPVKLEKERRKKFVSEAIG